MMPSQGQAVSSPSAADKARSLLEEGLSVIPLGSPNETPPSWFIKNRCEGNLAEAADKWPKTPRIRWEEFQKRQPTDEEFEGWVSRWPNCNWAVITGKLVVVDADSQDSVTWCESGAITRSPRKVITAKGAHYYYRETPSLPVRNTANPVGRIDTRGHGGYVVSPGSVHSTGVIYTEEILPGWGDASLFELPCLSADDLQAIKGYNGISVSPQGQTLFNGRPGNLTFDATKYSPVLRPTDPDIIREVRAALTFVNPDESYDLWYKTLAALKQLADEQPECAQAAFELADTWSRGGAKYRPGDVANKWPTFSSKPGAITWKSIFKLAGEKGWRNSGRSYEPQTAVAPIEPNAGGYDLFALANDPRETPPFVVDGLFRQGDNVILAGPPKSMKSFLMGDLLYGMAFGRDVLGFKIEREHRIAWLQAEMPWYETRLRANAHPWVKERMASGQPSNLWVSDRDFVGQLDAVSADRVINTVNAHFGMPPQILAIDSLAAVYDQESEIDNTQMMAFLNGRMSQFRRAWGQELTIFLIHHTAKMSAADMAENPFGAIRGASAIRGWYSAGMVMYRDPKSITGGVRHLHFELRGAKEPERKELTLNHGLMSELATVDLSNQIDEIAQRDFMTLMAIFERQETKVSPARNSPHYAPKVMAHRAAKTTSPKIKTRTIEAFETALFQLLDTQTIAIENDERNRTKTLKIARGSAAEVRGSDL